MKSCFRSTTLAITALTVVVSAHLLTREARSQETPAARPALAGTACAACHAPDGGGGPAGPSLVIDTLPSAAFIAYVRAPSRTMPAFSAAAVSDEDLYRINAALASRSQPKPEGRVEEGKSIFQSYGCYYCHAIEGQGGMNGPRLAPNPISYARLSWYVRHPTGAMPPYSTVVMSEQDMADVYAFLEARPQPKPLSSIPLLAAPQ